MDHPALRNKLFFTAYLAVWTVVGIALSISVAPLLSLAVSTLMLFGLILAYLFGGLSLLLWSVAKYSDYSHQGYLQRIISYVALALVSIGCWLGCSALLLYIILPGKDLSPFATSLPTVTVTGILLFIIVMLIYSIMLAKKDQEEQEDKEDELLEKTTGEQDETLPEVMERLAVKIGQKIEVIPVSTIQYVQAEGDYVMIYTATGHHLKEQTMKYFEEHLPGNEFVRVHRSFIVNISVISRIELFEKQTQLLILQNGKQIKTSASGYRLLKKTLNL
jgi:hypothetical protein